LKMARVSIAGLMGFVLVAALGFAGLKQATELWASGFQAGTVIALILGVLTAIQARGRGRAFWSGFAIAGWVYFLLVFGVLTPTELRSPTPLTQYWLDRLEAILHPSPGFGRIGITYVTQGNVTTAPLTFSTSTMTPTGPPPLLAPTPLLTPAPAPVPAPASAPAPVPELAPAPVGVLTGTVYSAPMIFPTVPANTISTNFRQISHSLATLLLAFLGGLYSLILADRRVWREEAARAVSPSSP